MSLINSSKILNIRRSFHKYVHTKLVDEPSTPLCFINYSGKEQKLPVNTEAWISILWLVLTGGVFTDQRVQLNVMSRVVKDQYGNTMSSNADFLMGALNVDTIPLYDFTVPTSPVDLSPYLIIPRFLESDSLAIPVQEVQGIRIDYVLYLSRGDII